MISGSGLALLAAGLANVAVQAVKIISKLR